MPGSNLMLPDGLTYWVGEGGKWTDEEANVNSVICSRPRHDLVEVTGENVRHLEFCQGHSD